MNHNFNIFLQFQLLRPPKDEFDWPSVQFWHFQIQKKKLQFSIGKSYKHKKVVELRESREKCNVIIPGNSKSLWSAVKTSKDMGASLLPASMTQGGHKINEHERSNCFATYFDEKIRNITNSTLVDPSVYNGVNKIVAGDEMFIDERTK